MNLTSRIIAASYIMVIVYLSLSFVYGRTGLLSTEELGQYRQKLYTNINELKKINRDLSKKLQPLNTMENVKLRAREMGYISSNERKIFLEGIERPDIYHSLGTIIFRYDSNPDNSQIIRSVSLIFSLLFYIFSSIVLTGRNGIKKIR